MLVVPKISVIIAAYNAQESMAKCLDSLINQDYPHVEIVLVNDGSIDATLEIAEQYKNNHPNIKLINQNNRGVSATRNIGIEHSTGDYMCFVDSDDWVEKNYCSYLYELLIKYQSDVSMISISYDLPDNKSTAITQNTEICYDQSSALQKIFEDDEMKSYACGKLFKCELFDNITFPEDRITFEDYATVYKLFSQAKSIAVSTQPLYHYIQNANSLSNGLNPIKAYHFFLAITEMHRFADDKNMVNTKVLKKSLKQSFMCIKRFLRAASAIEMQETQTHIQEEMKFFLKYPLKKIGLAYFIKLRCFVYMPNLYCKIVSYKK
jgi:glycosyltransferase involved in cell wall biosynthesis